MNNGQSRQETQNPFSGITAGIGNTSEQTNPITAGENLNQDGFSSNDHDYGMMGNAALESMPRTTDNSITLSMPPGTPDDETRLGEIVDSSARPSLGEPQQPTGNISVPRQDQDELDSAIDAHFADGEINRDDINFIKSQENERGPVELARFVMEARKAMTGRKTKNE